VKRGEIYRLKSPPGDTKRERAFVVVSRQGLIDSPFPTVICAPIYSTRHGISTEVSVGPSEGLKHDCAIQCDQLVALEKARLTNYVATLLPNKLRALDVALAEALGLPSPKSVV
jgi:mRNA interferase MazF